MVFHPDSLFSFPINLYKCVVFASSCVYVFILVMHCYTIVSAWFIQVLNTFL